MQGFTDIKQSFAFVKSVKKANINPFNMRDKIKDEDFLPKRLLALRSSVKSLNKKIRGRRYQKLYPFNVSLHFELILFEIIQLEKMVNEVSSKKSNLENELFV